MAFVNGYAAEESAGGLTIASTAQDHTSGNTIIVIASNFFSPPAVVSSVTDTAGNTYTKRGSTIGGAADHSQECWVADNITGNSNNVVTVTFASSATFRALIVQQRSGLANPSFDAMSTGNLPTSSTTQVTNNVTTTVANAELVGTFLAWGTARTLSSSGTSTLRTTSSGPPHAVGVVDRIAGAAGSYSTQVALNAAEQYYCATYAFQPTGGGGGGGGTTVVVNQMF